MYQKHLTKITRTAQYNFDRSSFLRLDANERVIPFSKNILSKLKKIITNNILQSYPINPKKVINLISRKEKLNYKYINIVPGSDSAIKFIFEIFSGKKTKVISIYPTYGMIEVYAKIYKQKLHKIYENKVKNFTVKSMYNNTSFLYIANPNQPSGKIISKNMIVEIIKTARAKKKYVVIDEAYVDFSKQKSCANLISKYDNLILLKTFSKSTGLAGLRIGYIICHPKVSKLINSVRPIFDVSHYSLKVAEYFLLNKRIIDQYLQAIKNSKKFVKKECLKRNLKFLNTEANFFHIFLNKKNVSKIYNFLKKNNILVKSKYSRGFKVLENSIRMTYGSRNQMKYFFTKFDKIYNR